MFLWVSTGLEKICILDSAQRPAEKRKKGILVMHGVYHSCIVYNFKLVLTMKERLRQIFTLAGTDVCDF